MAEAIIVDDGLEKWVVNPGDVFYEELLKLEQDKEGIRHTTPEMTEGKQTWWWRTAIEKAEKIVEDLAIPWEELYVDESDITDGNLINLSEKLAKTSYHIVQVNNHLTRSVAVQAAAKETLDHAVNRILARGDDINGVSPKPAIDARKAAIISRDKRLRNTKIELVESGALIRSLDNIKESLDMIWKTTSRILSARLHEPIDR